MPNPAIRLCTTPDGVDLAYTVRGQGPPLLFVRAWVSHLEDMWRQPRFRAFFETLSQAFQVIRIDARGNGLS